MSAEPDNLNATRQRLGAGRGKAYWRSLDELAETSEFQAYLHREFPASASEWSDPVERRTFLKLMGASLALAGATACTVQPTELIVPYVRQPEEEIPGRPLFFATAMSLGGVATGLLVESHEGRPTKIEGNPDHPGSLGATDLYAQASILTLYDPDRSQSIVHVGEIRPWSGFIMAVRAALSAQSSAKGAGLRILTETVSSPTLARQIQQILEQHPGARWVQWEPTTRDHARNGARLAFGDYVEPLYDLTKADVILSLDADFLASEGAASLRYSRQFASRRRMDAEPDRLSRLYVVEPAMTVTGGRADQRVPLKASEIEPFARALAAGLGLAGVSGTPPAGTEPHVKAIADDLAAHRGSSLVVAGDTQPPAVHALAHAINQSLGNAGNTVVYIPTPEPVPSDQQAAFRELVTDMEGGRVQMLLIIGEANPVQTAPADYRFGEAMSKVALRMHSGLFYDETATFCHWHVPSTHYLEAWSDARTIDGTVSIVQPLIQPLYAGKSPHEVIATLSDRPERNGYDLVREYWGANAPPPALLAAGPTATTAQPQRAAQAAAANLATAAPGSSLAAPVGQAPPLSQGQPAQSPAAAAAAAFERNWRKWLHDGLIPGTAFAPRSLTAAAPSAPVAPNAPAAPVYEVIFRRDPTIYDGRFANNGWLQELPKPVSKLTWDNAALIAPSTAARLEVGNGDLIEVRHDGRLLRIPAWIIPGHAQNAVTITVGYGRTRAGRLGNATGFNAWALRGSNALWFGPAEIVKTGDTYDLVGTQDHWAIEGRNLVRSAHLEEYKANPDFAAEAEHMSLDRGITLYPNYEYTGYKWGMAIDLNTCTGCSACVVACQAENNIPVVGKAQVKVNREMHWLRVDRYYAGDIDNPDVYYQPLPCMQCENAPCEVVCPVSATVHSDEGLNDMVYNRCVGTRYCSNNCPYKVRRFNFLLYQDWDTPSFKLQRNPDVTVRSRGVMEKCTYCVQRINAARIQSKRENRRIQDGEILTACQSVCPTDAIVFGDINDANSRVTALKKLPRNYGMLEELNTRPRTTYLAAVRNPNPALPSNPALGGHHAPSESPEPNEPH
ncbi:MAG: TAT-variant-translocated molybdopterin oxidoreductase [Acidobacteria bacterium]|nr:TAT-variant-translocated molybdopterin oxidoreductase [Acidobacteriota bacterium]